MKACLLQVTQPPSGDTFTRPKILFARPSNTLQTKADISTIRETSLKNIFQAQYLILKKFSLQ
jgi:hypothetical protein